MARINPEMEFRDNSILLEKLRFAGRGIISDHILRTMELEVYQDNMMRGLVYELRAHVMGHKQGKSTVTQPWSATKTVELDRDRGLVLPWFAVGILGGILGPLIGSAAVVALAMVCALVGVYAVSRNPGTENRVLSFSGEVSMDVTKYNTFPENTISYPPEMGSVAVYHQPSPAYFQFDDER